MGFVRKAFRAMVRKVKVALGMKVKEPVTPVV